MEAGRGQLGSSKIHTQKKKVSPSMTKPFLRLTYGLFAMFIMTLGCNQSGTSHRPTLDVPLEYADKHMPEGWWNDAKILSEGRLLYQGVKKSFVNCAECHGRDGKPVKKGASDLRNTRKVKRFSDSYWYWRIVEGVPMTNMKPYAKKLSEQEIWKIVAYQRNFGLRGQVFNPLSDRWEDPKVAQKDTSPKNDSKSL